MFLQLSEREKKQIESLIRAVRIENDVWFTITPTDTELETPSRQC